MVLSPKLFLSIALLCASLTCFASPVFAQTDAFVVQADIDFGTSDAPAGGTGPNQIGSNGNITYAAGYSGPASGTAGRLYATSNSVPARTLNISCVASGTMGNVGGYCGTTPETLSPIYISLTPVAPGLGTACSGLGAGGINTTVSTTLPRTIYVGADLNVASVCFGGLYKLSTGGGKITFRYRQSKGGPPVTIDVTMDASAIFNAILTVTSSVDMDFGTIEFSGAPGAGSTADIGTNGNMVYAGVFSGASTGTAGSVTVTGVNTGTPLQVFCDSSAVMTNGSGASINVTNIEVREEGATANFGSGSACNGLGGAAARNFTYTVTTTDTVFVGGRINGATAASFVAGSYSTANAGGNPIDITIINP